MNGIIIVNQTIGHNEYKIKRYLEEFTPLGVSLSVYVNDGTLAKIVNNDIVINLPKADFVIYLDKDIYLAKMLEKNGYKLFNTPNFLKLCDDKVLTYIECANQGIRMIKTFAGPLVYSSSLEPSNFDFLEDIERELGYPMIVKKVYGSLGEGVYQVSNHDELIELYKEIYRNPILFQQDITSSKGRSMRVLIIDGKVVGAFTRYNESDFRSNFGEAASSKESSNNDKYMKFAQEIADKLHIFYAGIDLLYDKNDEPVLCEINSNAFFEEFEKTTHINVAKLYAEAIIRHLK